MNDVAKFSKDISNLQTKYDRLKSKSDRTPDESAMINDIKHEIDTLTMKKKQLQGFMKKESNMSIEKIVDKYLREEKKQYKRVKIDSREAKKLQMDGWKMIHTDPKLGYVTFEK